MIILLDIDETLLENGETTCETPLIISELSKIKEHGALIGIATNRPFTDTVNIYDNFIMNGPLICEGGCIIRLEQNSKINILTNRNLNYNIANIIKKFVKNKQINTSVKIANKELKLKFSTILINKERQATSTIYLSKDLHKHFLIIHKHLENSIDINNYDIYKESNNLKLVIRPRDFSKVKTINNFLSKRSKSIYFISDYEPLPKTPQGNILIYSVGENIQYNSRCHFISKQQKSKGTLEILRKLNTQGKF